MALIDVDVQEGESGTKETKSVPFVGLPKYMPRAHAKVTRLIAADRVQKAAGLR